MGGIVSSGRKKELEREAELQKLIAARLAIFNKPPESDSDDEDDEKNKSERKEIKQLSLTENNVKVNSRKITAPKDAKESVVPASDCLDGPSNILDDNMTKVLEFMLDPNFDKVLLLL